MKLKEQTIEEIRSIAGEHGCRLLTIENAGTGRFSVLRIVLERVDGGGVTLDDCEGVSRVASALLDASQQIPHRYTLEVSSAGLDRKLYNLEDAVRFVGQRVRVEAYSPITPEPLEAVVGSASAARNFAGILQQVEGDRLTVVDESNRKIYNVGFGDIRVARLDFRWPDKGT